MSFTAIGFYIGYAKGYLVPHLHNVMLLFIFTLMILRNRPKVIYSFYYLIANLAIVLLFYHEHITQDIYIQTYSLVGLTLLFFIVLFIKEWYDIINKSGFAFLKGLSVLSLISLIFIYIFTLFLENPAFQVLIVKTLPVNYTVSVFDIYSYLNNIVHIRTVLLLSYLAFALLYCVILTVKGGIRFAEPLFSLSNDQDKSKGLIVFVFSIIQFIILNFVNYIWIFFRTLWGFVYSLASEMREYFLQELRFLYKLLNRYLYNHILIFILMLLISFFMIEINNLVLKYIFNNEFDYKLLIWPFLVLLMLSLTLVIKTKMPLVKLVASLSGSHAFFVFSLIFALVVVSIPLVILSQILNYLPYQSFGVFSIISWSVLLITVVIVMFKRKDQILTKKTT